jgi:hypothetical protein
LADKVAQWKAQVAESRENDRIRREVDIDVLNGKLAKLRSVSSDEKKLIAMALSREIAEYKKMQQMIAAERWRRTHTGSGEDDYGHYKTFFKECEDAECSCHRESTKYACSWY